MQGTMSFLSFDENNRDALQQSFNDLANLSRITDFLYGEHGQFEWQLDFFRIMYLIFQSAFSPDDRIRHENSLVNRFQHRFGRKPPEGRLSLLIGRMQTVGWLLKTQDSYMVTELGIRMISFLFDLTQQNFLFHQKDELQKAIFLSQLTGLKLEMLQRLDMDTEPEFLTLLYAIQNLTAQVKKNIPLYVQKKTAVEEILKLKDLMEESVARIEKYVKTETVLERIDDFRLKYHYVNAVLNEATSVCQEGLGEVIRAIEIASAEIAHSPIAPEKFQASLLQKIKEEFIKEQAGVQSVYEIILQMEVEQNERSLAYLPVKIWGGMSAHDIYKTIKMAEQSEIDFSGAARRGPLLDGETLLDVPEPQYLTLEEINHLEREEAVLDRENFYDRAFQDITGFVLNHPEEEDTVQDWILSLPGEDRFNASVFLDFLTYMQKLGLLEIDLEKRRQPRHRPLDWSFLVPAGYPWVLTGQELVKFPQRKLLEGYDRMQYKKFLKKEEE
jgi:hypothetical protein